MIFNIANGPVRSLPALDGAYPRDISCDVGASATFEVRIAKDGNPADYSFQWYSGGTAIPGATGRSYTCTAGKGTARLRCAVTTRAGTVFSRTATLTAETLWLYKDGTVCPAAGGVSRSNDKNSFELRQDSLHIWSTGHNAWGHVYFEQPVDLTGYTTLYLVGAVSITGEGNYWGQLRFGAFPALSDTPAASLDGARAQGTHVLDVSQLKGNHYISTYLKGFSSYAVANLQQVYLK